MTIEQGMVAALARHERAIQGVAAATSSIGKALQKCPIQVELDRALGQLRALDGCAAIDSLRDEKYRTKTHLWGALSGDGQDRLDDGEVIEYLADEETGCPHCAQAWELILKRKQARQEVGIAKRLIRYYGKQAIALQDGAQ